MSLYKRNVSSSIDIVDADRLWSNKAIYSIDGRRVGTVSNGSDPTEGASLWSVYNRWQEADSIQKELTIKNATLYVRKSRRAGIWF
ncbi:hypothetical protein [Prevotella sp. P2-180]|uniref:hypothetical protein n=1 Tax=Prevotella sp. P2-180 TaxID=2024224 RepID=UPI000B96F411|nr:hypothetical protein [Prevotella sp. P2-180]